MEISRLMAGENAFIVGSRALRVATGSSDLDVCVLRSDYPTSARFGARFNGDYTLSLLMNHSVLYRASNIDIFVFDDPTKLRVVKDTMTWLKRWPKFLLKIKWIRVKLFRYSLRKGGF